MHKGCLLYLLVFKYNLSTNTVTFGTEETLQDNKHEGTIDPFPLTLGLKCIQILFPNSLNFCKLTLTTIIEVKGLTKRLFVFEVNKTLYFKYKFQILRVLLPYKIDF